VYNRESILPESKEHWLSLRLNDITSTEISALFGISPYMTEFELFHKKVRMKDYPFEVNERMMWGTRLESSIAYGVAEDKGWDIEPYKSYVSIPEAKLGASFDFIFKDRSALVEIKNVDSLQYHQKWIDDGINLEAPPHIELQAQHQMLVSGVPKCFICALVGGNNLVVIERNYSEAIGNAIIKKAIDFWSKVQCGIEPEINFDRDAGFIKENVPIYIGDDIVMVLQKDHSNQIKMLIIAPKELKIKR